MQTEDCVANETGDEIVKSNSIEVGIKKVVNGFVLRISARERSIFEETEDHVFLDVETMWTFLSRELKEQVFQPEKSDD